jgi:GAF domain-containing protein
MTSPVSPLPLPDEAAFLAGVEIAASLDLFDSPPEESFDAIARTAARLMRTPTALISLLDVERQWFKARIGIELSETPLRQSFCRYAVAAVAPLVILDAARHPTFADNPLVTQPGGIRFYAGAPIVLQDGATIGTLCVIDSVAREGCAPEDLEALSDLASVVGMLIVLRTGARANTLTAA